MVRSRNIFVSIITFVIAVIIALIIFFVKQNKYKKNKVYVDSVVLNNDYALSFIKTFDAENGRAAVWIGVYVSNNTTTTLNAKFTDVSIKDDKGSIHKADGITLTIPSGKEDHYYYGYYCDKGNDTTKYILHFKLNGKVYNVCFKNNQ